MIVGQSWGHFRRGMVKATGLQYPNIFSKAQQKAGKRIFKEK
jgi:hypothetical protein